MKHNMKHILVVDDAPEVQLIVSRALGPAYEATSSPTLAHAWEVLNRKVFDLILLDVSLPDGDGFGFISRLRSSERSSQVPVVFLTSRNEVADRVMGYELGAEDYIPKPVEPLELKARVEARLKSAEVFRIGPLRFDLVRQLAFLSETRLELSGTEFKLLHHFARHEGHVLSRDQLLSAVWSGGAHVVDRVADVYVCALRKKIRDSGYSIRAVYGSGYRFTKA
jgi:two-component system phosphate regulon response regulator PhoB